MASSRPSNRVWNAENLSPKRASRCDAAASARSSRSIPRIDRWGHASSNRSLCPPPPSVASSTVPGGTVSNNAARQVFDALWAGEGTEVDALIAAKGLKQMNDAGALEAIAAEVIAKNAKSVEEYRAGKDKAFNALVGQAMKATKGKANPAQVNELLKKKLG